MYLTTSILVLFRVIAIALALSITATSYRAYRRTGDQAFQYTTAGFAMLVFGLGFESYRLYRAPMTVGEIHLVPSSAFAIGFAVLYLSING
jgi:hypothetical protein